MESQKTKAWLANNILTIMTIIFPTIATGLSIVLGFVTESLNSLDIVLIIIVTIFSVSIIFKTIWNIVSYKSYHYPWRKIRNNYNYEIIERKITYTRTPKDVLQYSRYMNIKACSNHINYIIDKYFWTGNIPDTINIEPSKGISNIENKSRIGIWRYFMMELDNHINRGDTKEIEYKWPDIEACSQSSPFFSVSTDSPTKKITLSLNLGKEYANQEIVCEEFTAIDADYPIKVQSAQLDDNGIYTWIIQKQKIKRFRQYRIRWSWTRGQQAVEIEQEEK
ncbi:MAG: hypothetical protein NC489_42380 [Ruminococcus flavefaciens]|nr:hypothetical protein [Ruminococcus flavefaciens]